MKDLWRSVKEMTDRRVSKGSAPACSSTFLQGSFMVLLLLTCACKSIPTSPTVPATFTLAPGESAKAENAQITFVRVDSDSRCPIDVVCIQAGDATIVVRVSAAGLDGEYELALMAPGKQAVTHRGYVITFKKLEPPRDTRRQPNNGDYRATIEIARP